MPPPSIGRGSIPLRSLPHGTSINHNGTARILQNLGVLDRLDLVPLPEVYRLKSPELDLSVPQSDPEAFIQLLSRTFPARRRASGPL